MTTTDKSCPDQEVLQLLLIGRVPAEEAVDLEDHLAACERCAARAVEINREDELIVAMQAKQLPPEDDGRISELIEHLREVNAEVETSRLGDTYATTVEQSGPVLPQLSELLDPPEAPDEMGRIGQYRVLDVLGAGGMGLVLRAEDPHLKRKVAIKVMKGDVAADESAKSRFFREAQATAAIEHDNIVTIYQVAEHHGLPYYAMQFLRGESLDDRLKREGNLDQSEVLRIGREIAAGLAAAHAEGLLHRDIKPDNIWLEEKTGRAKIVDFGLARDTKDEENITLTGVVLGTPRYMAPEQALGKTVDQRCDLFSLGSVMYHLATGQAPFKADNLAATLMAVVNKQPQPMADLQPEIDEELVHVIDRLLAKEPDSRFQSAAEVVEAIRRVEQRLEADARRQQEEAHSQPTFGELYFQQKRRRRLVITTAIGTLLVAILLGVIFVIQTQIGTLRVEVNDDNLEVLIDDKQITVTDKKWKGPKRAAKHRLAIKLGDQTLNIGKATVFNVNGSDVEHRLTVKLNGFDITSNEFDVVRGDNTVLTISFDRQTPTLPARMDANAPPLAIAPFVEATAKQHQQAWADYLGLPVEKEVDLPGGEKMTFMLIPPGEFMMGSTDEDRARWLKKATLEKDKWSIERISTEGPQHRVRITRAFYLAVHEVTQEQYQQIMGENPSYFSSSGEGKDAVAGQTTRRHPVENVTWRDAVSFCNKLSALEKRRPNYVTSGASVTLAGGNGYRLPTEAEWEYACRAGGTGAFCFADESKLGNYAWYDVNSAGSTHPVGEKLPNGFGAYDMHGNVWEWCWDWWDAQQYLKRKGGGDVLDPFGPAAGSRRVYRGGFWFFNAGSCRSAIRGHSSPGNRFNYLGFRLAMSIDAAKLKLRATASDTWADLFNGEDLSGWKGLDDLWRVENGQLVGSSAPNGLKFNTSLVSDRRYRDFEMQFEAKLSGNRPNSGLQVRSELIDLDTFKMSGAQVDMGSPFWGSLYSEGSGQMMQQFDPQRASEIVKPNEFNKFYVRCAGKHVTIKVNGATAVDGEFPVIPNEGSLGWQLHRGGPMEVIIRNVQIRELNDSVTEQTVTTKTITPDDGWVDLLAAVDMSRDALDGGWWIENGEVVGTGSLNLPIRPMGNFVWEIEFTTEAIEDARISFKFPHPTGVPVASLIKGPGLRMENPADTEQGSVRIKDAPAISHGEIHTLTITRIIEEDATSIVALVDGKPWAEWAGDSKRLATRAQPLERPYVHAPKNLLTIHSSRLRMLDGQASLLPSARPAQSDATGPPPLIRENHFFYGGRPVRFSRDGRYVLTTGMGNGQLTVHDARTGEKIRLADQGMTVGESMGVTNLTASPVASLVAGGGSKGQLLLWDYDTGELRRELEGHEEGIANLKFTPDGGQLLSLSHDRTIRVWDVLTGEQRKQFDVRPGSSALAISPNGRHFAEGAGTRLSFRDIPSGEVQWTANVGSTQLHSSTCVFSSNGERLAMMGYGPEQTQLLAVLDTRDGGEIWKNTEVAAPLPPVINLRYLANDRCLLSAHHASPGTAVCLWDAATGQLLQRIGGAYSADVSPDGMSAVTLGPGLVVRIWRLAEDNLSAALADQSSDDVTDAVLPERASGIR